MAHFACKLQAGTPALRAVTRTFLSLELLRCDWIQGSKTCAGGRAIRCARLSFEERGVEFSRVAMFDFEELESAAAETPEPVTTPADNVPG